MKKILLALGFILFVSLLIITCNTKTEEASMTEKKVLVAYFSATGTTKKLAENLAKATSADLFEITPERPYTDADLDWQNSKSRSSLEMQDRNFRPAISSKINNIDEYEVIFVGFPVWWYREPSIIDTFMEAYDFTGKVIIPFATSGGSPIGDSGENLQALAPKAKVFHGKCFSANASEEELKRWAAEWL